MLALPLICSSFAALAIAPAACRSLAESPLARENYRGRLIASPLGIVVVAAALVALGPLALAQQLSHRTLLPADIGWISVFVLGVALLGLADDALAGPARGWRGNLAALRAGRIDTGALKAVGTLGLALFVMLGRAGDSGRFLLGAAVLSLSTNAFNLIDLRPGRAIKALVLLGAGLTIASGALRPLWALGLFAGPALVLGVYDLRERGMLGDTGANLLGALAGAWMVLTLSLSGMIVALGLLVLFTVYGEFRSISALVERAPVLRHLDSIGRPNDAIDA
jgi:UDP-N-acetylmuramyl pentapeptide phosphotransferase/UDP-N-acetylglucosamine-1-phosphate transferase